MNRDSREGALAQKERAGDAEQVKTIPTEDEKAAKESEGGEKLGNKATGGSGANPGWAPNVEGHISIEQYLA